MPAETESLISELEQRAERDGNLPLLPDFYLKLMRVQAQAEREIIVPRSLLAEATAGERLRKGEPLLRFRDFRLDRVLLERTFREISRVFSGYPGLFELDPEVISKLDPAPLLETKALGRWFTRNVVPRKGLPRNVNRPLVAGIILSTLKPYLVSYRAVLMGLINQEQWRQGYCPVCGGMPDIAYLESGQGARWLVCSRCDAEWLFQRMACPHCDNLDQATLAYYTDESGRYRLYVCEKCRQYLKTVDSRQGGNSLRPALERLETLDLDRQARERGYQPGRFRTAKGEKTVKPPQAS